MQFSTDIFQVPFLALYAETHFRFFRGFPSILFTRQPEIVFDTPRRLDPGEDLPVSLIVNDCLRFPVFFSDCAIAVSCQNEAPVRFDFPEIAPFEVEHPFRPSMRAFVLRIPRCRLPSGLIHITCRITVKSGKSAVVVVNDNLRSTGKLSYSCYVSDNRLPGSDFCSYGDLHVHSQYSQSHVEFGPPVAVIDAMARASGLSFAAITDHSYDLACSLDDYLVPDPGISRWKAFQKDVSCKNGNGFILLPGEEVSCLNAKNEVVHLRGLGLKEFIPGSLDGARKDRRNNRQLTVAETVNAIHAQGGIAVAAHPGVNPGFAQRLFLSRGSWSELDARCGLDALQIFNNGFTPSWFNGKKMWINMLRRGYKVSLAAGNDAHGDFNRYRAIAVPFLAVSENNGRYMGYGKTGIYGKRTSTEGIVEGIKEGATFITTGPFAAIGTSDSLDASVVSRIKISSAHTPVYIHAISTPEFGALSSIEIYGSEKADAGFPEKKCLTMNFADKRYRVCEKIDCIPTFNNPLYLRAEVTCEAHRCFPAKPSAFTSAVYFS
jgi:hypothetical protein